MFHQKSFPTPPSGTVITFKKSFLNAIYLFTFWLHHAACGISVRQLRIEPMPPAVEARNLNHWTAREVPGYHIFEDTLF